MDVWLLQEKQVAESAVFVFSVGLDVVFESSSMSDYTISVTYFKSM
jgi:hypothetical protein